MKQLKEIQSESINELAAALSKAQGAIEGAIKDSANPFFKSKYADLSSYWDACREQLSKNSLCVTQTMNEDEDGEMCIITQLSHSSGQWMRSYLPINMPANSKNALQDLGSALTYLRRYSLAAIVGICPDEDDDGNKATDYKTKKQPLSPPPELLSQKHLYEFALTNFEHLQNDFVEFSLILKNSKQWNYDTLLKELSTDPDKTRKTFVQWCEKRLRERNGIEEKKDG